MTTLLDSHQCAHLLTSWLSTFSHQPCHLVSTQFWCCSDWIIIIY